MSTLFFPFPRGKGPTVDNGRLLDVSVSADGATENAGVENVARVECARVENAGISDSDQ